MWQGTVGGLREPRVQLNSASNPDELGGKLLLRASTKKHSLLAPCETLSRGQNCVTPRLVTCRTVN